MNNFIKMIRFPVAVICCILLSNCYGSDEYKQYMPDGEIIYPQKADAVNTYTGKNRIQLEWVIVDPKVTSCKVFYEQSGITGETTVPINAGSGFEDDTIRVIIPDLEETTYAFRIISFDDYGNASIPVETEESAYGDMYESSLLNRTIRSYTYNENEGLNLTWYAADETEIGITIEYTDVNGANQTMIVSNTETSTAIPDFKISEPIHYRTMHKPTPTSIDIFYAQPVVERIPYWANITADLLKNTEFPFNTGDMIYGNRYYTAVDWKYNDAGIANGNVDTQRGGTLVIIAYSSFAVGTITNGKLYQSVELESGTYRFDVQVNETSNPMGQAYIVAALGDDLPNTNRVTQDALAYVVPPVGIATGDVRTFSLEFDLSEKSVVSLGFVVTFEPPAGTIHQIHFRKVELWERR